MKNLISYLEKSINHGMFFVTLASINTLILMMSLFLLMFPKENAGTVSIPVLPYVMCLFSMALFFPLVYICSKPLKKAVSVKNYYFNFFDFLMIPIFIAIIYIFSPWKSILGILYFVGILLLWILAVVYIYKRNQKNKKRLIEEEFAKEKKIATEEEERRRNIDLILSSFFFSNKDKNLPIIKNEVEAEDRIDFAQLCLEIDSLKEPSDLMDTLKEITFLPLQDKSLLAAVVALRLAKMRNVSISELYKTENL